MNRKQLFERLKPARFPTIVLSVAVILAIVFIKTKPSPKKQKSQTMASAVKTLTVLAGSQSVTISAMGTVVPAEEVALQPEVTGLIVWKHRNLVPGGIVRQGETLLRVDSRNYEVAMKQQKAALEKARVEYQLELSRSEVAAEEWQLINPDEKADSRAETLALREPQLRAAKAAVQAASNMLAKAILDVERTSIVTPFNAVVIDEFVDRGQLVSPQTRLAHLTGTDAFRVDASLPVRDLQWMRLPDSDGEGGPAATVLYDIGSPEPVRFNGKVTRVLSSLDNAARMARILVRVEDPLMLAKESENTRRAKLLSGAYVKVLIEGLTLDDVIEVPDSVIQEGNRIWVMNAKDLLEIRSVQVVWRQGGRAIVKGGIVAGDRVVSSHISTPVSGMKLKTKNQDAAAKGASGRKPGSGKPGSGRKGAQ